MNEVVSFYIIVVIALLVFQYFRYKKKVEQLKSSLEFETSELMPEYHKKMRKFLFVSVGIAVILTLAMTAFFLYLKTDEMLKTWIIVGVAVSLSTVMVLWLNRQKKKYLVKKTIILTEEQREDVLAKYKQNYKKSVILLILMSVCLGFTNLK